MKENTTIFDYLMQVMIVFGFSLLVLNLFCIFVGDAAKDYSTMFDLGSMGISVATTFQYLVVSTLIVAMRFLFFTDVIIRKMTIWLRTVSMVTCVILIIAVFAAVFRWFPVNMAKPWIMFFICFGISFVGSFFVMRLKEKAENKKLNDALDRLKEKETVRK